MAKNKLWLFKSNDFFPGLGCSKLYTVCFSSRRILIIIYKIRNPKLAGRRACAPLVRYKTKQTKRKRKQLPIFARLALKIHIFLRYNFIIFYEQKLCGRKGFVYVYKKNKKITRQIYHLKWIISTYLFKFYAHKITAYATFLLYSLSTTIAIPAFLAEFHYIPILGAE